MILSIVKKIILMITILLIIILVIFQYRHSFKNKDMINVNNDNHNVIDEVTTIDHSSSSLNNRDDYVEITESSENNKSILTQGNFTRIEKTIIIDSLTRNYAVYEPKSVSKILILMHGGGGNYSKIVGNTKITEYFDINDNTLLIVPNGIDNNWNDERVTSNGSLVHKVDDEVFINNLIDIYAKKYSVNVTNIYLIGLSNGGIFTHNYACKHANVGNIFTVVGNFPVTSAPLLCTTSNVNNVLMLNSPNDQVVPYEGGAVGGYRKAKGFVLSVTETVKIWQKNGVVLQKDFSSGHEWPMTSEINATNELFNFVTKK